MKVRAVGLGLSSASISGSMSLAVVSLQLPSVVLSCPHVPISFPSEGNSEPLLIQSQVSLELQRKRYSYSLTYDGLS